MKKEECYYLGKITRTNGNNGGLSIYLDVDDPSEYQGLDAVFVEIKGQLIPFFIEEMQLHTSKNTAVVYFEDVVEMEQAAKLANCHLYLPLASLPTLEGNKFYFHEVIGFELVDKTFGKIGTIDQILDYPNQALFQTFLNEKEVLVPINDAFIELVDRNTKTIFVNLPEGLLDIYLDSNTDE